MTFEERKACLEAAHTHLVEGLHLVSQADPENRWVSTVGRSFALVGVQLVVMAQTYAAEEMQRREREKAVAQMRAAAAPEPESVPEPAPTCKIEMD